MTDNVKLRLRKKTSEMLAILSISDPIARLKERNLLWTLFVDAAELGRPLLEAWVRKRILFGHTVPMMGSVVEELCDRIEEIALQHLLDQMQGEEPNPSYCLGWGDRLLQGYFIRMAFKHNLPRDARNKYVVAYAQNERIKSGRPYLVLATDVDTSGGENDESTFPEYKWGVDALWLEDVEELMAHDRFRLLDDTSKIMILLDKMDDGFLLRDFDEAATRYGIDHRFLQPYRRRLSLIKGKIMGVQRIAYVMDISEPTVRKRLEKAYRKLDSPALVFVPPPVSPRRTAGWHLGVVQGCR